MSLKNQLGGCFDDARILQVGCGGTGCEFAKIVANFRVDLTLVDFDRIELTNLHRQFLFGAKDIGRFKAEVGAEILGGRGTGAKVQAICESIYAPRFDGAFFAGFDAVVLALDNEEARSHVNGRCLGVRTPLFELGTHGFMGQAYPIFPGVTRCYDCEEKPPGGSLQICSVRSRPTKKAHCAVWAKLVLDALLSADVTEDMALVPRLDSFAGDASARALEALSLLFFDTPVAQKDADPTLEVRPLDVRALLAESLPHPRLKALHAYFATPRSPDYLFDKDNEADVEALENLAGLRADCFAIEAFLPGEARRLATRVVPAISSTNSLVAGLLALELAKFLTRRKALRNHLPLSDEDKARLLFKEQYVSNKNEPSVTNAFLTHPKHNCLVCSSTLAAFRVDFSLFSISDLVLFFERRFGPQVSVFRDKSLITTSEDIEEEKDTRSLSVLGPSPVALLVSFLKEGKECSARVELSDIKQTNFEETPENQGALEEYSAMVEEDKRLIKLLRSRGSSKPTPSPSRPVGSPIAVEDSEESVVLEFIPASAKKKVNVGIAHTSTPQKSCG